MFIVNLGKYTVRPTDGMGLVSGRVGDLDRTPCDDSLPVFNFIQLPRCVVPTPCSTTKAGDVSWMKFSLDPRVRRIGRAGTRY